MKLQAILGTATLAAFAASQSTTGAIPPQVTQAFNPGNVSDDLRTAWCRAERNNCPLVCGAGGGAAENTCTESTLAYSCVCQNGTTPDLGLFADTLPTYICLETFSQCVNSHPDDLAGQNQCDANREYCGTRNASAEYLAQRGGDSSTTSAGASATSGGASETSGSASASATTDSNDASRYEMTSSAFAAVLFAGLAFLL